MSGAFFDNENVGKSSRDSWLLAIFAIFATVLFIRLFFLQVVFADEYSGDAQSIRTTDEVIYAKRGTIYDRNGNVLAMSVDATDIYANPKEITDPQATADQLAAILGGDSSTYLEKLTKDSTFVYIQRQADTTVSDTLQAKYDELQTQIDSQSTTGEASATNPLAGIHYEATTKRVYPYGEVGGQIIGYVGTDGEGLSGLELYYNDILAGQNGHKTVEQGKNGIQIPGGTDVDQAAVDGQDIMISIDISLQQQAEETLSEYAAEGNAEGGNVTVVDGATGEIYCSASLPFYNLNDVSNAAEGASQLKSVSDSYEPGSTFKTVTSAILLEEGLATPDETITVPGSLDYGEYTIHDAHSHGTEELTFTQILEQSSNIGISLLEGRLQRTDFADWLDKLGFGRKTGIDYPGETTGILRDCNTWSDVQESNIAFGQGISVSSIQMAAFYGTIANGGTYVQPHFLIGYPDTGETVTYESNTVLSKNTCSELTKMLTGVVEDGTGSLAAIEGYEVAGKTGTAQKIQDDGTYSQGAYIIGFDGFLAYTNSDLACAVMMDNPGTSASMPVFANVMKAAAETYGITNTSSVTSE